MRKTCLMRGLKILMLGALATAAAKLTGCAEMDNYLAAANTVGRSQGSIYNNQTEPYNGPKARVAVMDFQNKTGTGVRIGDGMKEQLVTALAQTGAFILLERDQLNDVLREQNLGASGRANPNTAAPIGGLEGADFLIYGAVTEYEANQAGGTIGGEGQRATPSGDILGGALNAAMNQDHVAIDLRLVDAKTSRIVGATTIQGRARDLAGAINGQFSGILANASGHYNTPIEKSIRACMIKASNWIADNTLRGGVQHVNEEQKPGPYTPRGDRDDNRRREGDRRGDDRRRNDDRRRDVRDVRDEPRAARPERRMTPAAPATAAPVAGVPGVEAPVADAPAGRAVPNRVPPRAPRAVQVPGVAQPGTGTEPAAAPVRVAPARVAPGAVQAAPAVGTPTQMTVAVPSASVYLAPAPGNRVIGRLPQGSPISVLRQQNGWAQVRMRSNAVGWVQASELQ